MQMQLLQISCQKNQAKCMNMLINVSKQGVMRKSSCDMFCKQTQAAEISYFVESIENKKKISAKIVGQSNANNGTDTISANAPVSSPRPGISPTISAVFRR
jgi:hypothetical protein